MEVNMPNNQKTQNCRGNKSKNMRVEKNKSRSKNSGQSTPVPGQSGLGTGSSTGNKGNTGNNR